MRHAEFVFALLLGVCLHLSPTDAGATASTGTPVGGEQCVECHESESQAHVYHGDCTNCHANGLVHAEADSQRKSKAGMPDTKACLTCHERDGERNTFAFAEHNRAGVECADCHGMHKPKVELLGLSEQQGGKTTALCATCHQDVIARFNMPSHHPVPEGGVTCTGCHNPHEGRQTTLANTTERCTSCHQAVRGPFVFEHPPAVESCANCHDSHGSPVRKLLTVPQPVLCLQCHSIASNRHGQTGATSNSQLVSGAVMRDCGSCHGAVHGSSTDQHLRH